ncbi:MAG: hypothetical protein KR126chlam6_00532 [Candidatus Anoxychlamydiales bacterium]|nr:hypothetical protein [Candidatus Anoxychlamydiales bacterium]
MKATKLIIFLCLTIILILIILFRIFLWWNESPILQKRSNPPITTLNIQNDRNNKKETKLNLKIVTYNIHFGIGEDGKTIKIDKKSYENRLDQIAKILKTIDADIVFLQEIDFTSKRSHLINQKRYIAKKAGYNYMAIAPTLRGKFHLNYHRVSGKIKMGLCVLSKHPIIYNEAYVFENSKDIPFFATWLYDPHGAQKCTINFNGKNINLINVHLDPWSHTEREKQINIVKNLWLKDIKIPTIIGGDFNSISPNEPKKEGLYLDDAPWFINKDNLAIKDENSIKILLKLGFKEAAANKLSIKAKNNFTYPSIDPKEKIDYIFAGYRTRVIKGHVYTDAKTASDHLPVVAEIKINGKN